MYDRPFSLRVKMSTGDCILPCMIFQNSLLPISVVQDHTDPSQRRSLSLQQTDPLPWLETYRFKDTHTNTHTTPWLNIILHTKRLHCFPGIYENQILSSSFPFRGPFHKSDLRALFKAQTHQTDRKELVAMVAVYCFVSCRLCRPSCT